MINVKKLLATATCLCGFFYLTSALANGYQPVAPAKRAYLSFEGGAAFSLKAAMDVPLHQAVGGDSWDQSPQGYNTDLGTSAFYGVGFGYDAASWVTLHLDYVYRPDFTYKKYQTAATDLGAKTRYFDLDNSTLMLNALIHLGAISNHLKYQNNGFMLEPFIDVGAGLARNTVSNFHSVSKSIPGYVFSKMANKTYYDIAGQAGAGLNAEINNNWLVMVGYRFLYGGKFKTQNYINDDPDNLHPGQPGAGNIIPAWTGKLMTNEVYVRLGYRIP